MKEKAHFHIDIYASLKGSKKISGSAAVNSLSCPNVYSSETQEALEDDEPGK
jgi:hypothetical protein